MLGVPKVRQCCVVRHRTSYGWGECFLVSHSALSRFPSPLPSPPSPSLLPTLSLPSLRTSSLTRTRVSRLTRTPQRRCRLAADAKRWGKAAVGCPVGCSASTATACADTRETAQARRTTARGAPVPHAVRGCFVLRLVHEAAATASEQLVRAPHQRNDEVSVAAAPEVSLFFTPPSSSPLSTPPRPSPPRPSPPDPPLAPPLG